MTPALGVSRVDLMVGSLIALVLFALWLFAFVDAYLRGRRDRRLREARPGYLLDELRRRR